MRNVAQHVLPNGAVSTARYDRCGRASEMTSPRGAVTRIRRDVSGRPVRVESFTGVEQLAYDAEGNLIEAESGTRHVRLRYGHFHKLVAREEAGATVGFEYDTEDQLTCVLNEAGERYEYHLDKCGRISVEKCFDGSRRERARDALGRVIHEITPAGRRKTFTYDDADRVARVEHLDKTFSEFEYRSDGALMFTRNQDTWVRFERDALGRTTLEDTPLARVASRYDSVGRGALESSLGARALYLRDQRGGIANIFLGAPSAEPTMEIARDACGAEVARWCPGGLQLQWTRDALGRPLERSAFRAVSAGVELIDARAYDWRGADQIAAIISNGTGRTDFTHDARGRLIATTSESTGLLVRAADEVGNVYRSSDRSDRVFGPGGRLTTASGISYSHDADGNLIEKRHPDGSVWKYRWRADGRLHETERPDGRILRNFFDALGRRYKKQLIRVDTNGPRARDVIESTESERWFVWDGSVVLHEVAGGVYMGPGESATTTWYTDPGTFTPIARQDAGGLLSIASDHLGTPTEMFDEAGRLAWRMQLDAFGVATDDVSAVRCPWRFPGQYEDAETGLYYNINRFYDPADGRYISKDPIGLWGGLALYGYVADPTTWSDPLGLAGCDPFRTARDTAFFWSGSTSGVRAGPDLAAELARLRGGTTLEMLIAERRIGMPVWVAGDLTVEQAWSDASQGYAEGASGIVRAVIGQDLRPGAIWVRSELGALITNPDVTSIIRIDPATLAEVLLFSR